MYCRKLFLIFTGKKKQIAGVIEFPLQALDIGK